MPSFQKLFALALALLVADDGAAFLVPEFQDVSASARVRGVAGALPSFCLRTGPNPRAAKPAPSLRVSQRRLARGAT